MLVCMLLWGVVALLWLWLGLADRRGVRRTVLRSWGWWCLIVLILVVVCAVGVEASCWWRLAHLRFVFRGSDCDACGSTTGRGDGRSYWLVGVLLAADEDECDDGDQDDNDECSSNGTAD